MCPSRRPWLAVACAVQPLCSSAGLCNSFADSVCSAGWRSRGSNLPGLRLERFICLPLQSRSHPPRRAQLQSHTALKKAIKPCASRWGARRRARALAERSAVPACQAQPTVEAPIASENRDRACCNAPRACAAACPPRAVVCTSRCCVLCAAATHLLNPPLPPAAALDAV